MKKTFTLLAACACAFMMTTCGSSTSNEPIALFNGENLDNWEMWLSDGSTNTAEEFTVVSDGGENVIRLSGKFGYIKTKDSYSDYTLEFQWRWVDTATNSGVFVHVQPGDKEWPHSYEYQLCVGKAGDLVNSGGSSSAEYEANPASVVITKKNPSNEKPVGEWNQGKVICEGNTVTVFVNGLEQNKITGTSLTEGRIGLQSEGEAIEFRNVVLTPLGK